MNHFGVIDSNEINSPPPKTIRKPRTQTHTLNHRQKKINYEFSFASCLANIHYCVRSEATGGRHFIVQNLIIGIFCVEKLFGNAFKSVTKPIAKWRYKMTTLSR